jgi:hypothetical protein
MDETWVHYFTPENKRSSMQWHHPGSPKPKEAKIMFSAGKVMATVFWDSKGVLYMDFLTERRTINTEYNSSFLQDNAHPHVAARTMDTIQKLKWNVLPHPSYSRDLAPSDYHLFSLLKEYLGGKSFRSNEEVIQAVQEWLHRQPKDLVLSGIRKLLDRWCKCITNKGDYVEK